MNYIQELKIDTWNILKLTLINRTRVFYRFTVNGEDKKKDKERQMAI